MIIETVLSVAVVALAAGGLGLGLVLGRGPARTSCGAIDGARTSRCADCPLRRGPAAGEGP